MEAEKMQVMGEKHCRQSSISEGAVLLQAKEWKVVPQKESRMESSLRKYCKAHE